MSKILPTTFALITVLLAISTPRSSAQCPPASPDNIGGPPAGYTGAPGAPDNLRTCTVCHAQASNTPGTLQISPPPGYVPNGQYTIQVQHTTRDSSRKAWGFELTSLTSGNTPAGTFTPMDVNTQTRTLSGRLYIEQTLTGAFINQLAPVTWTFTWTAPSTDVGPITFYAAGLQADHPNGISTNTGDQTYTDTALVPRLSPTPTPTSPPATATPTSPPATATPTSPPATATPTSPPATATPTSPPVIADGCYPNSTTAEGCHALSLLTTGQWNTALGAFTLWKNTDGSFNTAVGTAALLLNIGNQSAGQGIENTAVGAAALLLNTSGAENTAIGIAALETNSTDGGNTAVGAFALLANTAGLTSGEGPNTAVGLNALIGNTTGNGNVAVGATELAGEGVLGAIQQEAPIRA